MFKKILVVLMFVLFTFPLYAADMPVTENSPPQLAEDSNDLLIEEGETVVTPVIEGIVYTQEVGSVYLSDGTIKNYNAQEMGYSEFEWYFSNLKAGKPEPILPKKKLRYIAITTEVKSADPEKSNILVHLRIGGVMLEKGIEDVTSEGTIIEEEVLNE